MQKVIFDFLLKHWKPIAGLFLLALVAVFSFALGRQTSAKEVEYVERVQVMEVVKERIVLKEVYLDSKAEVKKDKTKTKKKITEKVNPDGSKETTVEETTDNDVEESKTEIVYRDRIVEKEVEKIVEVEKLVTVKETVRSPDWRSGLTLGVRPMDFAPRLMSGAIGPSDFILGASVERRIYGPAFTGIYAATNGTAGLTLSLEF